MILGHHPNFILSGDVLASSADVRSRKLADQDSSSRLDAGGFGAFMVVMASAGMGGHHVGVAASALSGEGSEKYHEPGLSAYFQAGLGLASCKGPVRRPIMGTSRWTDRFTGCRTANRVS